MREQWEGIREMEEKYSKIKNMMINSVKEASGKVMTGKGNESRKDKTMGKKNDRKRNPVSWWDRECEKAVEYRTKCLKKMLKDKALSNWIEYRRAKANSKKGYKEEKKR